jgi:hypothetical protein
MAALQYVATKFLVIYLSALFSLVWRPLLQSARIAWSKKLKQMKRQSQARDRVWVAQDKKRAAHEARRTAEKPA